eukprot:Rmarinus@m.24180
MMSRWRFFLVGVTIFLCLYTIIGLQTDVEIDDRPEPGNFDEVVANRARQQSRNNVADFFQRLRNQFPDFSRVKPTVQMDATIPHPIDNKGPGIHTAATAQPVENVAATQDPQKMDPTLRRATPSTEAALGVTTKNDGRPNDVGRGGGFQVIEDKVEGNRNVGDDNAAAPADMADLSSFAVLLMTYNRPKYLRECLSSLMALAGISSTEVLVSQDGSDPAVLDVVREYEGKHTNIRSWQHPRDSSLRMPGPYYIAQHYKFALGRAFEESDADYVIIVEDDMVFSPDFLSFFQQTAHMLHVDPTIWCVSSWNDNGFSHLDLDETRLFRNSYFPGLGWMIHRSLWGELAPNWPDEHWDHWMRLPTTSKDRECVVPQVSRNYNIGVEGINMHSQDYQKYLKNIQQSTVPFGTSLGDLSYLRLETYDATLRSLVEAAKPLTGTGQVQEVERAPAGGVYLLPYKREGFKKVARELRIWDVPRAEHRDAIWISYKGKQLLLVDQRRSPFIPQEFLIEIDPALEFVAGSQGQSCRSTCVAAGKRCSEPDFDFGNRCDVLMSHFPCEKGCGTEMGRDIPNYVSDKLNENFQRCLTTEDEPTCDASHRSTSRLCPCMS